MESALESQNAAVRALPLLLLIVVCAAVATLALHLAQASLKATAAVLLALSFPFVALITGRVKELLIVGWIVGLTYNRQYFSFEALTGNNGTQGPYWIAGDICFAALLLLWAGKVILTKRRTVAKSKVLWPWFLPLALACVLSVAAAQRPDWSLYELIRFARFALVLAYVRHNFGRREWITAICALGLAISFQSLVGAKEIITGHSGVLGLGPQTTSVNGFEDVFSEQNFYGWVRATGTMGHPPNLACYLILVIPVFLGLGLTVRRKQLRLICWGVFLLGCVGLGCTLSRWPWVLAAVEAAMMLAGLVVLRETRLQRAAGLTAVGIFALCLVLVPLRQKFVDRLTRDFSASIDERQEGNRVAIDMIKESPWLGVGLNNSKLYVVKYAPDLAWAVENEDFLVHVIKSRSLAAMGNGLFFVTVETGIIGTLGFLICLAGVFIVAIRAIWNTRGAPRAVCLGLAFGLFGVLLQELVDFSLWVDPLLYTTALCIGLLNVAPVVFRPERERPAAETALVTREVAA